MQLTARYREHEPGHWAFIEHASEYRDTGSPLDGYQVTVYCGYCDTELPPELEAAVKKEVD